MNAGWAWQIEHDEYINRGYVYSSKFLSDDQANEEFKTKNPKITETRVLKFDVGVRRRTWVKNLVAFGNAAGFVEPLEATAIGMVCDAIGRLIRGLKASDCQVHQIQKDIFNRVVFNNWELVRDFLAVHYRFNNRYSTPFWKACNEDTELGQSKEIVDLYRKVGPDFGILSTELKRNFFGAEGYITLLLGQQVPFERSVEISKEEQSRWQALMANLTKGAMAGVTMPEYLMSLRLPGAKAINPQMPMHQVPGEFAGQLRWH